MNRALQVPKEWLSVVGEIAKFAGRDFGEVFGGKVFKYSGEALRQCGVLVLGSALTIWTLMFILGLTCGTEGAYFNRTTGAPSYAGVFAAWCDLREVMPYGFGYMMSAKVGTGLVAEIGAMQIADEVDALEVMGISSMTFLVATRLIAAMLTLPFMYLAGIGVGFFASYTAGGGPVGVGTATAKSMVVNLVLVHLIGMLGTQLFWGANPRAPIGG